ncbi:beta-alanine-activating enzyme [Caerostris extrusa]|uniref:Beta-alanine-activating enzyme n=1 Tax=Caerostris extrusa TaxID=172846 RepID=A0AAV4XQJ0_CAEEX|nr:beta-alanine-activating enzyme [Caerostris extrusa]
MIPHYYVLHIFTFGRKVLEEPAFAYASLPPAAHKRNACLTAISRESLDTLKLKLPLCYVLVHIVSKADYKKILLLKSNRNQLKKQFPDSDFVKVISKLWKDYTNQEPESENDNFVLKGGDSIKALQFVSDIEWDLQVQVPELVDTVLNYSFKHICELLRTHLQGLQTTNIKQDIVFHDIEEPSTQPSLKKICISHLKCFEIVSRRGYSLICNHSKELTCNKKQCSSELLNNNNELSLTLHCKFDLKKCIDSSPCCGYYFESNDFLAFIGSHSGLFCCFNVLERSLKWTTCLPNRIESSSYLSSCGNYVYVGCYDHNLYCLNIKDGSIWWKFNTNAEVKSSPVVSSQNIVFVGSHDKHLYAINGNNGELLWKKMIGKGSIYSSPALLEEHKIVSVATLDGIIASLEMDTGVSVWTYNYGKPIFFSPLFISTDLFIGATNNCFLHFNLSGTLISEYNTNGPVFSSATCITSAQYKHQLVFGCHDSIIYCVTTNGKKNIWKFNGDSPIYATPFAFQWKENKYVAVASTVGIIYILSQNTGEVIQFWRCPGEIFSSPIVSNGFLIIGCRDNYVYCFNLSSVN